MFCPYCNSTMALGDDGEFRCQASGAAFSQKMSLFFAESFGGASGQLKVQDVCHGNRVATTLRRICFRTPMLRAPVGHRPTATGRKRQLASRLWSKH